MDLEGIVKKIKKRLRDVELKYLVATGVAVKNDLIGQKKSLQWMLDEIDFDKVAR